MLTFEGCNFFRQRLVLSTLSGKAIKIIHIRDKDEQPGLTEYEANFLRLLDMLTDGSRIEVNESGTVLYYKPGVLVGGNTIHDCNMSRSMGYYLEPIIMLAPFMMKPISITLKGITNGPSDPSVDYYRMCVLPRLKIFLPDESLSLKILERGFHPEGVGKVTFTCPVVKKMPPVVLEDCGRIKRIRGIVYTSRVSPSIANRIIEAARGLLNKVVPDVYIYTDLAKKKESKSSPGYGVTLVAESTTGTFLGAEVMFCKDGKDVVLPEDLGQQAATLLFQEILSGGCCDSVMQVITMLFMAMGEKNVSKIKIGNLTDYSIQFLRHMRDLFQVTYKVDSKKEEIEETLTRQGVTL
ncbi:RNA 3'-terminal phosphate cyclase-like protein isoform X2 [Dysidea avara]|uniref:RNA 3'-terminal phosphate cyclase-like protein isoform X2 n=1 Tax=Dysidea avara TaxID=196820 RepID=UPI003316C845